MASDFDLSVLSQRLAPRSAVSFGNVLARELLIGAAPRQQVMAIKLGPSRTYRSLGYEVVHLSVSPHVYFGFVADVKTGVQSVDPEKAVLDILYFHQRGQRFFFDPFSDVAFDRLSQRRLRRYLTEYRNPKFVCFAMRTLGLTKEPRT